MRSDLMMLATEPSYELYRWAERLMTERDYYGAADLLETLIEREPEQTSAARMLLARAYFHSARLERARAAAAALLEDEPDNAYAAMLLGRSLQRLSRRSEAEGPLRRAAALGLVEAGASADRG